MSQVTMPATMQTKAPTRMASDTPKDCARPPASMLPNGVMPPKINAQIPITRPRILSEEEACTTVFVVAKNNIMPQPAATRQNSAAAKPWMTESSSNDPENSHRPVNANTRGVNRRLTTATVKAPASAPRPFAASNTP